MNHALDYRDNYPHSNPERMTTGQMLMIAGGALAVGGISFAIYAKMKQKKAESGATDQAA